VTTANLFQTHLLLPDVLRYYLRQNKTIEAATLSQQYETLEYFAHGLEILLHRVLDEEVDTSPKPEDAVLPRVLSLLSSFKEYLDVVLQCTRKTEVRQWKTLFAYLPPAQELFEESLQRGSLKTAGGYLIVLYTLEELESTTEQGVRLLSRAMAEGDWELCKELARFLAAMDDTGEVLRQTLRQANNGVDMHLGHGSSSRLEIPVRGRIANGSSRSTSVGDDGTESDVRSGSDTASIGSRSSLVR
jgi:RAB6A-GEF complex partner protein 1